MTLPYRMRPLIGLMLLIASTAQADEVRRAYAVPLPQAPSSLPPPPWDLYGRGAVGVLIADPWSWPGGQRPDPAWSGQGLRPPFRDEVPHRDRAQTPRVRW